MKTLKIAAIILAVMVALLGVSFWVLHRHQVADSAKEQRLRDSLMILTRRGEVLGERERLATAGLAAANRLLDDALSKPPQVVYVTRRDTIVGPGTAGTVDTTVVVSEVPYVPKITYDTLASRCSVAQASCTRLVFLKDSIHGVDLDKARTLTGIVRLKDAEIVRANRRTVLTKIEWFGIGAGTGGLICLAFCR